MTLNFLQEKKEADFRYGLVRVRENAESIAFMVAKITKCNFCCSASEVLLKS